MNSDKNEINIHRIMTVLGGFMGAYAISLPPGNFASAVTGNSIETLMEFSNGKFQQSLIRLIAIIIFGTSIVIYHLMLNYTKINIKKLAFFLDALGLNCLCATI